MLLAYPSNCATTPVLSAPIQIGNGWGSTVFDQILAGDFDGDGCDDIITRRLDTHTLWLYAGTCNFSLTEGRQIGNGWSTLLQELHTSDTNGDGCTDIVTRRTDSPYLLVSYLGGCNGAITGSKEIGSGWVPATYDPVFSRDLSGDKCPDVITRATSTAKLRMYRGNCAANAVNDGYDIGSGWDSTFNSIF
jgi:hypothetical protein